MATEFDVFTATEPYLTNIITPAIAKVRKFAIALDEVTDAEIKEQIKSAYDDFYTLTGKKIYYEDPIFSGELNLLVSRSAAFLIGIHRQDPDGLSQRYLTEWKNGINAIKNGSSIVVTAPGVSNNNSIVLQRPRFTKGFDDTKKFYTSIKVGS